MLVMAIGPVSCRRSGPELSELLLPTLIASTPNNWLCSQIVLVAHLVSHSAWILNVTVGVRRAMQETEMRKPESKRFTAALRQMTSLQRKIVAVELAVPDAQP